MAEAWPLSKRPDRWDLLLRILLAVLLAGWIALQLRNLGVLSLWMDEGFHYLAAQGILAHGYPLYPSGHIYWKAILYAYILAGGAIVFGLKAVTLRVFSVLCVAGMIALAYHFGRRYFSRTVGFLAAVILAMSAWELEYARLALYFAPLQLFYLLGLYFFYRGFIREEGRFKTWAVVTFLLTPLIHQLGMGVIFAYAALFLMRGARRFFRKDVLIGFTLTVLFYLGIQLMEFYVWQVGYVYEKTDMSLGGMIAYFFGSFSLDYFKEFFRSFPWMSLAVLAGIFLCLGAVVRRRNAGGDAVETETSRSPWLFLNLCLIFPLFFFAFFRTHVQPRYLAQLFPVFVLLFLVALRFLSREFIGNLVAPAFGISKEKTRAVFSAVVFLGLVLVLTEGARPGRVLSIAERNYGDPITVDTIARSGRYEHYDHESVGRYVAARLKPSDTVIAIHVVFQKIYVGRVDYWLWSGGPGTWDAWEKTPDGWKDFYVGARWINNLDDLRKVTEAPAGGRVWLVTSPSLFRLDHIDQALHDYVAVDNADKLVFRGKDGMSEVYVWNDPNETAGGRRTVEGEWMPSRRGTVVGGPNFSGGEALAWDGTARWADEFTAKAAGIRLPGSYRALVRYKTGPESPDGPTGRIAVVDGRGNRLRTVALTSAGRPADENGWREAEVEFFLDRDQNLGAWVQVPPGCAVTIDYIDIRPKEEGR
jgi:hypothetical protein